MQNVVLIFLISPGMYFFGLVRYTSNVSGDHVMPEMVFRMSKYISTE